MPDAVVIQWARLGDVLQTRVLLRRLRQESRRRIILCADAQLAPVAAEFPEMDEFWGVELAQWSAQARHAASQPDFLRMIAAQLSAAHAPEVAEVYVLNRSLAAVTFAEILRPRFIRGYTRFGHDLQTPTALEWLESARRANQIFPVHIADIWAELSSPAPAVDWLPPLSAPPAAGVHATQTRVGFICDAGARDREIPKIWLIELAYACAKRGWECVLLGRHKREESLWQKAEICVKDCRGQTNLTSLMRALTDLNVVVGPDTGGLHLAAALGVPVIGLYFGGASAVNTGPYANNAVVVQDPEWTGDTVNEVLRLLATLADKQPLAGAQHSNVLMPSIDDNGICYVPNQNDRQSSKIMHERKRLFDLMRRQTIPAVKEQPVKETCCAR